MTEVREMGWGEREKRRERETILRWLSESRVGTRKGLLLVDGYINPAMRSQPNSGLCDLGWGDLTSIFLSVK